jgi:hypothetical protein
VADDGERWPRDVRALQDGYERLRATVLSGGAGGWRLGHGVLSASGMAAWMSAFGELAPPVVGTAGPAMPSRSESRDAPTGRRPVSSLPAADQVVAVLTQMVLPLAA